MLSLEEGKGGAQLRLGAFWGLPLSRSQHPLALHESHSVGRLTDSIAASAKARQDLTYVGLAATAV